MFNCGIKYLREINTEEIMGTETTLENDTFERLRYLLNNFNSLECHIDIYSQYIKNTLMKDSEEKINK